MDFETVVKTRRSVRSFAGTDVPDDVLDRVLNAARLAPSANNKQPWHFVVVRDRSTRKRLAEVVAHQEFIAEAPVVIACCGQKYTDTFSWIGSNMHVVDVTIAVDHLTLAARNEGLGTCWIGAFDHEAARKLLKVPETHNVVMIVPVGYPTDDSVFRETQNRLPLDQLVSTDQFA